MDKTLRVGMIGYGFMGKAHSNAWRQAPRFFSLPAAIEMRTICGRNAGPLEDARAKFGWENTSTDWHEVVNDPAIDIIDVTTSNLTHAEIAIAAAKAGKHVFCEKPLCMNVAEARKMIATVKKAGVKNMVGFNYRRVPAVAYAKKLIESGALGIIRHFRAVYLQSWIADPKFPMNWRLRKEVSGSGAHGDLNAHLIDLAHFLVGDISEVVGLQETFMKERPRESSAIGLGASAGKGTEKVTVDDASVFLAKFAASKAVAAGAYGTFEATRLAPGHHNYNCFEVNGSEGSVSFCFERMNELQYCNRTDPADQPGFKTIMVTEGVHPYVNAWWPSGHVLGYEHTFVHEVYDFVNAVANNKAASPDFVAGAKCVAVLEAAAKSNQSHKWVKVPSVN